MVTSSELYIIGNGFDIHHGIPSRYSDFKDYLVTRNKPLHDHVIEYLPVEENWCDLEMAFAHLDVDNVIDEATQYLQSYSAENWSDSFHHDYQFEIEKIVTDLSSGLKAFFCQWISQLELPLPEYPNYKLIRLHQNSMFLNFNYTRTLQHIYGVSDENIVYIHGEAEQGETEIILGHSWSPEKIPDLNYVSDPESMDTRIMEGNDIVNSYFGKTFKPSEKIIKDNINFFSSIKNVSKVFVLGHSLSKVDLLYFVEIVKSIKVDAEWIVTYYGNEELARHKNTIDELGIKTVIFCDISRME